MTMTVLGVDISDGLLESWRDWLAPPVQPFFVPTDAAAEYPAQASQKMTSELRDTYALWNIPQTVSQVWLDEPAFMSLPIAAREALVHQQLAAGRDAVETVRAWTNLLDPATLRQQAGGHRFVWWPSLVRQRAAEILQRVASRDHLPSRHRYLPDAIWESCAAVLPRARELSGTFANGSGPNCFGTVMAAAGVPGAEHQWMQQKPFEVWLAASTVPGGDDAAPGTVLVWRGADGVVVHAAVTLGAGWGLEKSSQRWVSPRSVQPVSGIIRANRTAGCRLRRHTVLPA